MNKKLKLKFYADLGHGWLAVKRKYLESFGIEDQISPYSYEKGQTVYLEEDCDASLLLSALDDWNIEYSIVPVYHAGKSAIRSYNRYRA